MPDIHHIVSRQVRRWMQDREFQERALREHRETLRLCEAKPVVTVSRQRGSRGHELAKLLAHELNYGLFDHTIVNYIADHIGVRSELIESLDERNRSELELWIQGMLSGKIFSHDNYIHALIEVIKTVFLQGGVVIVGRGANYILAGTHAFHLRVIAPEKERIRNLVELEGMTESQAVAEIKRVDPERADFVKRYFHADINDPLHYDLVINMARTSLDAAVKTVLTALRARGWKMELTGGDKRAKVTT
ncbi:MAG TPA: cytidylate kinase-like family protein [bacterium]|nr:cytidylate kinase-like family protein [Candidatus Omnitrophota bacterium]HOJ61893.1 cytidylate kinase-like family protein [bacterium]HOL96159.1 cytidylate kinase-like family protein [bacterium]HPP00955.1 cytidylate kinase-like family protein [bacterium]